MYRPQVRGPRDTFMNILKKIIEFLEKNKGISFVLMLITLAVIWYFSSIPGNSIPLKSIWPSIIYHFFIFALFSFFLLTIIAKKGIRKKDILIVFLISLVFSFLDEIHQAFVPLRSPDIKDILVDLAGVISASILVYFVKRK